MNIQDQIEKLHPGFVLVTNLIKEGHLKIQKRNTEDGLNDIREAISLFVVEIVKKVGGKPFGGVGSLSKNETV